MMLRVCGVEGFWVVGLEIIDCVVGLRLWSREKVLEGCGIVFWVYGYG